MYLCVHAQNAGSVSIESLSVVLFACSYMQMWYLTEWLYSAGLNLTWHPKTSERAVNS